MEFSGIQNWQLSGQGLFVFDYRKRYLQNFNFETFPSKLSIWKNCLCWRWCQWSLCSIGIDILWFNMSKARLSFTVIIRRTYCSSKNCSMERWHRINEMFTILNIFLNFYAFLYIYIPTCGYIYNIYIYIHIYIYMCSYVFLCAFSGATEKMLSNIVSSRLHCLWVSLMVWTSNIQRNYKQLYLTQFKFPAHLQTIFSTTRFNAIQTFYATTNNYICTSMLGVA